MAEYTGNATAKGLRCAIVASRYNDFVTTRLVAGAVDCLKEHGGTDENIDVYWCPGALEVPALAAALSRHGRQGARYDVLVAVGCVIRGETDHYEHVCRHSMEGVAAIALEGNVAVGNAILTVGETQQAVARSGQRTSNKGWEAALAALEMASHLRSIRE
jgi:6,7-dimethyl-8-ribityllumazine synthase